jgi:hypothetical protein
VSASRGLTRDETAKLASGFDLATAAPEAHAMPGAVIERFDVQRSTARSIVADSVARVATQQAVSWIPGSRYRNLHVAVLLRQLVTRRLAFPSYVLAYRYKGDVFRAVVHGQDAAIVIGSAPYSWVKILAAVAGTLAAVALLFLVLALLGGAR